VDPLERYIVIRFIKKNVADQRSKLKAMRFALNANDKQRAKPTRLHSIIGAEFSPA
jgi:hypothetical protein